MDYPAPVLTFSGDLLDVKNLYYFVVIKQANQKKKKKTLEPKEEKKTYSSVFLYDVLDDIFLSVCMMF